MNPMKIQKRAYREIWNEGKTHQEVYDNLRNEIHTSPEELATMISAVPTPARNREKRMLWMLYALILAGVAGLRLLAVVTLTDPMDHLGFLIPTLLFGVLVPLYGMYGATRALLMSYGWVGMSLLTTLILLFAQTQHLIDSVIYLTAGLTTAGMVLAGLIPRLLKRKFEKNVEKTEVDGKTKSRLVITFPE